MAAVWLTLMQRQALYDMLCWCRDEDNDAASPWARGEDDDLYEATGEVLAKLVRLDKTHGSAGAPLGRRYL
jgi:hypothetical protein